MLLILYFSFSHLTKNAETFTCTYKLFWGELFLKSKARQVHMQLWVIFFTKTLQSNKHLLISVRPIISVRGLFDGIRWLSLTCQHIRVSSTEDANFLLFSKRNVFICYVCNVQRCIQICRHHPWKTHLQSVVMRFNKNKFTTQMYPITKKGFILTFCYNITCEVKCVLKEEISF